MGSKSIYSMDLPVSDLPVPKFVAAMLAGFFSGPRIYLRIGMNILQLILLLLLQLAIVAAKESSDIVSKQCVTISYLLYMYLLNFKNVRNPDLL